MVKIVRVQRLLLLAARFLNKRAAAGYLLLEVLLALACLLTAIGAFSLGQVSLQRELYRQQLRTAAHTMAADIRKMQQQTMFQPENYMYELRTNSLGYKLYKSGKVIKNVKLKDISLTVEGDIKKLSYTENGNPSASGTYSLKHKNLAAVRCQLSVQPVTGRVTFYERK